MLGNTHQVEKLKAICNDQTIVEALESRDDPAVLAIGNTVDICFSNINMNTIWTEWLSRLGVTSFIATLSPRRIHKLWKRQVTVLYHSTFEGVTDCTQQFYFPTRSQLQFKTFDALKYQCDAHSIINDSIWCSRKRRKPVPSNVMPLSVQNISTAKYHTIYQIGGLLPYNILPCITIATPGKGLPKGTWGIQKMPLIEICVAADISHDLILSHIPIFSFFDDNLIPARLWMVAGCMTVNIHFT